MSVRELEAWVRQSERELDPLRSCASHGPGFIDSACSFPFCSFCCCCSCCQKRKQEHLEWSRRLRQQGRQRRQRRISQAFAAQGRRRRRHRRRNVRAIVRVQRHAASVAALGSVASVVCTLQPAPSSTVHPRVFAAPPESASPSNRGSENDLIHSRRTQKRAWTHRTRPLGIHTERGGRVRQHTRCKSQRGDAQSPPHACARLLFFTFPGCSIRL